MTRTRLLAVLLLATVVVLTACGNSKTGSSTSNPTLPELTTETGWVVDTTGKMSSDTMSQLQSLAKNVQSDGYQMGIFIFSNCACEPVPYATEVANKNGIGVKGKDNGITVVVFLDKEGGGGAKPAIGVAIGSGLEGQLNDAKVGRLLDATFVPARSDGNWETGLITFVTATRAVLNGTSVDSFKAPPPKPIDIVKWVIIVIAAIIAITLDGLFFQFTFTRLALIIVFSGGKLGGGGRSTGGGVAR